MSRTPVRALRFPLLACALLLFRSAGFVARQTSTVQGTVSDLDSRQPLPNVLIVLSGEGGYFRATSDRTGRFLIDGVAAGDYKAEVTRDGYFWRKRLSGAANLTVTAGQELRNLSFHLLKASAISGRILNEHGDPDSGISVTALRLEYRNGTRVLNRVLTMRWARSSTDTDRKGEYRLYGLEPGEYYLRAGSTTEATYYPGTKDPSLSVPLRVLPGRDLTGVNLSLSRAAMYTVTVTIGGPSLGTVGLTGTGGEPGTAISASIIPRNSSKLVDNAFGASRFTSIGPNRYRSSPLLPGEYELKVELPGRHGRIAFDITNQDVDAGVLTLSPGITLNGRIRLADSATQLKAMRLNLNPVNGIRPAAGNSTSTEGTVTIRNVAEGQYWIEFLTLPADIYVQSVRYGASPPDNGDIAVGKESEGPLEIVLATGSIVTGTVRNTRGENLPYSSILIYPSIGRQHPSLFKTVEADKNGSFTIYGVAPGEYSALAWEDAVPPLGRDPEFLRTLEQRATTVVVQAGNRASIDVRAIPSP